MPPYHADTGPITDQPLSTDVSVDIVTVTEVAQEQDRLRRERYLTSRSALVNKYRGAREEFYEVVGLGAISGETASAAGAGALAILLALYLAGGID